MGTKILRTSMRSLLSTTLAVGGFALASLGLLNAPASAQGAAEPTISWGYFQGGVSTPGAVIGSQSSLSAMIPAHLKFIPINSGVAGLAAMRAGSFQVVEGVGNPPVVGALAARTPLLVVFAESYDGAGLYVNTKAIHNVGELAGQKIGDLVGSSEDYELKGYLRQNGLIDKVQIIPFASDAAAVAAFLAGNLNAVYTDFGAGVPLTNRPGTEIWTTAAKIALMGYPSINVLAVSRQLAASNKELVQKIVCAVADASADMVGPDRAKYFADSATLLGEPADVAIKGSESWPELTLQQQELWFGQPGTSVEHSKIVQEAYMKSADFLKNSGTVPVVPSASQIAVAVDPSFVEAALKGACK